MRSEDIHSCYAATPLEERNIEAPIMQAVKTRSAYAKKPLIGAFIPVTQYTKLSFYDKKMTRKSNLTEK